MSDEVMRAALADATDTRDVAVGRGVIAEAGERITAHLPGPYVLVADESTWAVAGEEVTDSLIRAGTVVGEPLIFPARPAVYASYANCERIRDHIGPGATGVAVGSGTLNDLVKLAAHENGRGYAVVGTAASMDGYTGFGAPMSQDGVKVTRGCPAPVVAVLDLDVVSAAPASLTASGPAQGFSPSLLLPS